MFNPRQREPLAPLTNRQAAKTRITPQFKSRDESPKASTPSPVARKRGAARRVHFHDMADPGPKIKTRMAFSDRENMLVDDFDMLESQSEEKPKERRRRPTPALSALIDTRMQEVQAALSPHSRVTESEWVRPAMPADVDMEGAPTDLEGTATDTTNDTTNEINEASEAADATYTTNTMESNLMATDSAATPNDPADTTLIPNGTQWNQHTQICGDVVLLNPHHLPIKSGCLQPYGNGVFLVSAFPCPNTLPS